MVELSSSLGLFICYLERDFGRSLSPREVRGLSHILELYEKFQISASKLESVMVEAKL